MTDVLLLVGPFLFSSGRINQYENGEEDDATALNPPGVAYESQSIPNGEEAEHPSGQQADDRDVHHTQCQDKKQPCCQDQPDLSCMHDEHGVHGIRHTSRAGIQCKQENQRKVLENRVLFGRMTLFTNKAR